MTRTVLITGGAGGIGHMLTARAPRDGWRYVILDQADAETGRDDLRTVVGSITDRDAVREAMCGVTDVIHLAAVGHEDLFERIVEVNIEGMRVVLEEARDAGVARFVFASSHHAVGFATPDDAPEGGLPDDAEPRPDTYYGWSKASGEAMLRVFCERFGMIGVAWRIGHCFDLPRAHERLPVWLSPGDARRFIDAALENDLDPFTYVWGVSSNTRGWLSGEGARRIGYAPQDDSEDHAHLFPAGEADPLSPLGGTVTTKPLGER
ncbi:NAD-dependent epimerase/dehydratase family protein [Microbacterium gubbeenense]|uniref:NAD-dependent epimerase/dehydratase family protein n=1 Tax=Microbacterium gubbeenense TaxID=159896 RepID=UPI003F9989EA